MLAEWRARGSCLGRWSLALISKEYIEMSEKDIREGLIQAITDAGFFSKSRDVAEYPVSIICAQREPVAQDNGLSFWVTNAKSQWHLCSWLYRYWKIPNKSSVIDVCVGYLNSGTDTGCPPESLVKQFQLEEINLDEFKLLRVDSLS